MNYFQKRKSNLNYNQPYFYQVQEQIGVTDKKHTDGFHYTHFRLFHKITAVF